MVWFRENWYEEVLRQLRAGLAKCHVVAFHHRAAVADATVTPHTLNFIKKVVSTFGIGIGISKYSPTHDLIGVLLFFCLYSTSVYGTNLSHGLGTPLTLKVSDSYFLHPIGHKVFAIKMVY